MARVEWILDGAVRVLTIVFAPNRVWQPTTKRPAERVAPPTVKPDRLAERIEVVAADFRDPSSMVRAMEGAHGVFSVQNMLANGPAQEVTDG